MLTKYSSTPICQYCERSKGLIIVGSSVVALSLKVEKAEVVMIGVDGDGVAEEGSWNQYWKVSRIC